MTTYMYTIVIFHINKWNITIKTNVSLFWTFKKPKIIVIIFSDVRHIKNHQLSYWVFMKFSYFTLKIITSKKIQLIKYFKTILFGIYELIIIFIIYLYMNILIFLVKRLFFKNCLNCNFATWMYSCRESTLLEYVPD